MSTLRESVIVDTPVGRHEGVLALLDGLPSLYVSREGDVSPHTPQTFPACWRLSSMTCGDLYAAWRDIEAVMDRLRDAQREAGADERREPDDDITAYKRNAEARGER